MLRSARHTLALGLLLVAGARAAGPPATVQPAIPGTRAIYDRVIIDPARTSIYVGRVTLTMAPLVRADGIYTADYSARVFPFFFFSEHGRLQIDFSADELGRLERGETVNFKGRASNSSGDKRRIEGRAVPEKPGADQGQIKVRVILGKIELIFHTAYHFTGGGRVPPAPGP